MLETGPAGVEALAGSGQTFQRFPAKASTPAVLPGFRINITTVTTQRALLIEALVEE